MGEDEKLVERVRNAIFDASEDEPEGDCTDEARAAISAVRAHDAERGLVLVPRAATEGMERAALKFVKPYHDIPRRDWAKNMPSDIFRLAWGAMVRAAPTQREQGEG